MSNNRPFPADYTYDIRPDGSIHITDLDLGNKSVTNDVEGVLSDLAETIDLAGREITYLDSSGQVDRILHDNGKFTGFAPLRRK